jgi:DNA-binding PadR family transcriptional regulator
MSIAVDDLLSRLAGKNTDPGSDLYNAVAASKPAHEDDSGEAENEKKLNSLLARINCMTGGTAKIDEESAAALNTEFVPLEPNSIAEAALTDSEVQALALKYLLSRGDATGRDIAEQVKLPFVLVDELLRQLKFEQLVVYKSAAPMNDYLYQLTDMGRERAQRLASHCTYFGAAPVSLAAYIESVKAQSMEKQHPTVEDLKRAFSDLLINERMLTRLGPAINSGRGLFLYGYPGNGKTSIAERVTRAFGQYIWIPRAIGVDGEIIRVFDPMNHDEAPIEKGEGLLNQTKIDNRWVRIKRPTTRRPASAKRRCR